MQTTLLLGSNQGDRQATIDTALEKISTQVGNIISLSTVYESEPHGYESHNRYLNQAITVETDLAPHELLTQTQSIETELGRVRSQSQRYTDRTIDIDIMFYDSMTIETAKLTVPHPRIAERAFVLEPLKDIIPRFVHPKIGKTIEQIWIKSCKK